MRLLWQWWLPCNGPLDIQQLWASEGRTREPILMKFGIQQQIRTTMITWSNIKIFKIQNGTDSIGPIRTTLGWSLLSKSSAAKPFYWYWSLLLKRYGFMECRDQKHPQVWWTLDDCATVVKKIKSGRKTANINTKNLRSFITVITVKAHCSMTHLKQQKSLGFF